MLTEKMNAIFPLYHSIFFQPFPVFSLNVHITTELNGTIIKEQTSALFAGGELSEEDQANFIRLLLNCCCQMMMC